MQLRWSNSIERGRDSASGSASAFTKACCTVVALRRRKTVRGLKNCKNQVMKRFGVHFVTLASLDLRLPKDALYSSILNDEVAQWSELETLAAVYRVAGCLFLVGDHKQLCCLPQSKVAADAGHEMSLF